MKIVTGRKHQQQELSFSRHARERLEQRQLAFSGDDIKRIDNAVIAVSRKGGKLALILLDQLAMLVSVHHRRVITIAARENLHDNVFTNIDSAAIA